MSGSRLERVADAVGTSRTAREAFVALRQFRFTATTDPKPGFYTMRFVKGGAPFPVVIERRVARDPETGEPLDRSPHLVCQICDAVLPAVIGRYEYDIDDVWPSLRPTTEADYRYRYRLFRWAARHKPQSPEANPFMALAMDEAPINPED